MKMILLCAATVLIAPGLILFVFALVHSRFPKPAAPKTTQRVKRRSF